MTTPNPLPLYAGPDEDGDLLQHDDALTFVAARALHEQRAGYFGHRPRLNRPRVTGISSDALALYGAGLTAPPVRGQYPGDAGDLGACERTYLMAPDDVRERMLPVLVDYREHLATRRAEREAHDPAFVETVATELVWRIPCESADGDEMRSLARRILDVIDAHRAPAPRVPQVGDAVVVTGVPAASRLVGQRGRVLDLGHGLFSPDEATHAVVLDTGEHVYATVRPLTDAERAARDAS